MLRDNPIVKELMSLGEEKVGQLVNQLLASEAFINAVQTMVTKSLDAKAVVDKNVRFVLSTMSIPTLEDIDRLRDKADELGELAATLNERLVTVEQGINSINNAKQRESRPARKKSVAGAAAAKRSSSRGGGQKKRSP